MAANTHVAAQLLPWYHKQEFVDARDNVVPPGGRTRYGEFPVAFPNLVQTDMKAVKKRRVGPHSPTDVTAFHWG